MKNIFWNLQENRLRSLWRIILQLLLTLLFVAVPLLGLGNLLSSGRDHGFLAQVNKETFDQIGNIIIGPVVTILIYLSLRIGVRKIEKRSFGVYGSGLVSEWVSEYLQGVALGAVLLAIIFVAELALGWVRIEGYVKVSAPQNLLAVSFLFSLVKIVCVGIYEELISRGLIQRNLAEGITGLWSLDSTMAKILALILASVLFGVLHFRNPNTSLMSAAGISAAGMLFGLGYILTGRLALPIGLHMSWNLFQGVVFGFPVSGDKEPASILSISQTGNPLFTGGSFGPEAGLLGIAAALVGILILLILVRRRSSAVSSVMSGVTS